MCAIVLLIGIGHMKIQTDSERGKVGIISLSLRVLLALPLVLLLSNPAKASDNKQSPNEIVQVADMLVEEIKLVLSADGIAFELPSADKTLTERQPRHVLQKSREVHLKIQQLRQINGLEQQMLAPFPVRAVTSGDVLEIVKSNLTSFQALKEKYHVKGMPEEVSLPGGMTSTDAYKALDVASKLLDSTDILAVAPNDSFQVALTLNSDLEILAAGLGKKGTVNVQKKMKGKKSADAYSFAFRFHERIKELSETNERLKIPGGIVLLEKAKGKISPSQVMDLLNNILGDIGAMKLALAAKDPTVLAAAQSGKTPSNVMDSIIAAFKYSKKLS